MIRSWSFVSRENYLNEDELNLLNRMVTAYIEMAEIQAMSQSPMYMSDWIERLDPWFGFRDREYIEAFYGEGEERLYFK